MNFNLTKVFPFHCSGLVCRCLEVCYCCVHSLFHIIQACFLQPARLSCFFTPGLCCLSSMHPCLLYLVVPPKGLFLAFLTASPTSLFCLILLSIPWSPVSSSGMSVLFLCFMMVPFLKLRQSKNSDCYRGILGYPKKCDVKVEDAKAKSMTPSSSLCHHIVLPLFR